MHNKNITEGVKCVVNTCHYYENGDLCTAGKIEIRPRNASSSEETDCATFQPDNSMK
ncbi:DUF1540 domain-containing protein [Tissierella carlieri]|uniref:DUF1540 domain-containing protein n=1 Tax=Tissierella carlieri TaxID=689904 RepID=A0ABT1SCQ2_9FIRM|nr:DUF1540 domain-containing protein [Tissierella carlieri]MBU5310564.1 DUF1540 domain-containing protein [Tissierella carlieri]MCQ4924241.1 DUF1540 domain-containing protein [Tissierella carlieri]